MDAIEAGDDHELEEELGDLLLQVVFHCQLARERGAFDFEKVARHIADKLIRRHPHVFGNLQVKDVDQVWANWEKIKRAEKHGTRHARPSALDGIPKHLPALAAGGKLVKKAHKAKLLAGAAGQAGAHEARAGRKSSLPWRNSRRSRDGRPRTCCGVKSSGASACSARKEKRGGQAARQQLESRLDS